MPTKRSKEERLREIYSLMRPDVVEKLVKLGEEILRRRELERAKPASDRLQ